MHLLAMSSLTQVQWSRNIFVCTLDANYLSCAPSGLGDIGGSGSVGGKSPAPWNSSPSLERGGDADGADKARRRSTVGGETDAEVTC